MVLFFTALSVSIDAYAAGFAYGLTRKLGFFGAIYAGTITFFACLAAGLFRVFFSRGAMLVNFVSGMVLIVLGVKYMVGKYFGLRFSYKRFSRCVFIFRSYDG